MNGKQDDRRVRKTKKALRNGLAVLMKEKNIREITVRELAELVDMHRGTFYLHYKDIYDLQEQIENELIAEVTQILQEFNPIKYGENPEPVLLALMNYILENRELCQALLGSNANRSFIDKLNVILQKQCMELMAERFKMEGHEQEWRYFLRFLISGYIAAISKWTETDMRENPEDMAALLSRMGMHGIGFAAVKSSSS